MCDQVDAVRPACHILTSALGMAHNKVRWLDRSCLPAFRCHIERAGEERRHVACPASVIRKAGFAVRSSPSSWIRPLSRGVIARVP